MFEILVQGVGALGILASVISFQCKSHRSIVTFRTANELLFAIQYFLLGAYTGMAMNLIGCVRNTGFTEMVKREKKTTGVCVAFSALFLIITAATWAGPKSILVGAAKVVSTFAYGNKNPKVVRGLTFFTSASWLVYNWFVRSYAGVLCEVLTLSSVIVGIVRLDLPKKSEENA